MSTVHPAATQRDGVEQRLLIYYPHSPAQPLLDRLSGAIPAGTKVMSGQRVPSDYDVLIAGYPSPEQLEAPSLRTVVIPYAGLSAYSRQVLLTRPELAVYSLKYNGPQTAELAIALLLAAAKNLPTADQGLRRGEWLTRLPAVTLAGCTALVLGHGSVGSRVAASCAALGMRVQVVRRHATAAGPMETHPVGALDGLLPGADVVVVCLPLTPLTTSLLGRDELALLPRDAIVVNVGRAEVIEEEALFRALESRSIFAAALDVWYDEPSPLNGFAPVAGSRFPFTQLDNVVLSPHRGFRTETAEGARIDALATLLTALACGDQVGHRVDVEAGY